IDETFQMIEKYYITLKTSGRLNDMRKERIEKELRHIASAKIMARANTFLKIDQRLDSWVDEVFQKKVSPYKLLNKKIGEFLKELNWQ
ncbi:MAG: hypothetical protein DRP96_08240, partial [Candidatus Neomarinimicrobiota bacterium]